MIHEKFVSTLRILILQEKFLSTWEQETQYLPDNLAAYIYYLINAFTFLQILIKFEL